MNVSGVKKQDKEEAANENKSLDFLKKSDPSEVILLNDSFSTFMYFVSVLINEVR